MAKWIIEINEVTKLVINAYERPDDDDTVIPDGVIQVIQPVGENNTTPGWSYDESTGQFTPPQDLGQNAPVIDMQPTALNFFKRFTTEERVAIRQSPNPYIQDFFDELRMAVTVDLSNADVAAGMSLLVADGYITEERKTEILAPQAQ